MKLNLNFKAQTSEELFESQKTAVLDFGNNLCLEAEAEPYCGVEILAGLRNLLQEHRFKGAEYFNHVENFQKAINDMLNVWVEAARKARKETFDVLKDMHSSNGSHLLSRMETILY